MASAAKLDYGNFGKRTQAVTTQPPKSAQKKKSATKLATATFPKNSQILRKNPLGSVKSKRKSIKSKRKSVNKKKSRPKSAKKNWADFGGCV